MRSIRRRLTLGLLLTFALMLGAGGVLVYFAVSHSLYEQFDSVLRVKALTVITDSHVDDNRVRVRFSDRFLDEFDDDVATAFFQVWEISGQSAERSDSLGRQNLPMEYGTLAEPRYWDLGLPGGAPGRAIGIQFTSPGEGRRDQPREAVVVVAAQRSELDATLSRLGTILLLSGASLLGLTTLVVPILLGRCLRPLARVGDQAAQIDAGSLETRFPVASMPTELQPICGRLNALLARLEDSFDRERRFSSDIAHELRTPLAELRSLVELALKWPQADSDANYRQVLDIALQMEALVTRLLALGRAEQGAERLNHEAVALAPLIERLTSPMLPRAAERQVALTVSIPPDAGIHTDALLLQTILVNLLENAVHYTPAGGSIAVTFAAQDEQFEIQVINDTENLEPADLPHMFERFWRKDSARTEMTNSGLGLSLSRNYARLLSFELNAELIDNHRLAMTLRGPAGIPPAG